jgi:SAM-dependent methyltransferase
MPFADDQFDGVFCFAVQEHTRRPWEAAREMCRVLKPGGTIMVDWPFLQPVHGYPHHYYNATPQGNAALLSPDCDIRQVVIGPHHHPAIGLQWMLTAWRNGLPDFIAMKFETLTIAELLDCPVESLLEQDWCTALHPEMAKAIPAGSLVIGVKRPVGPHPDIRP